MGGEVRGRSAVSGEECRELLHPLCTEDIILRAFDQSDPDRQPQCQHTPSAMTIQPLGHPVQHARIITAVMVAAVAHGIGVTLGGAECSRQG